MKIKDFNQKSTKGQGAIEYLLLIGVALLIITILVILSIGYFKIELKEFDMSFGNYDTDFNKLIKIQEPGKTYTINVDFLGEGTGTISGFSSCSNDCTILAPEKTQVTLNAQAKPDSTFAVWGGDCTGNAVCDLNMNANKNITVTFNKNPTPKPKLTINVLGSGSGEIEDTGNSISCNSADGICDYYKNSGTQINLEANSDLGSVFTSWSAGPCAGSTSTTCNFTINSDVSVSATFTPTPIALYHLDINAQDTINEKELEVWDYVPDIDNPCEVHMGIHKKSPFYSYSTGLWGKKALHCNDGDVVDEDPSNDTCKFASTVDGNQSNDYVFGNNDQIDVTNMTIQIWAKPTQTRMREYCGNSCEPCDNLFTSCSKNRLNSNVKDYGKGSILTIGKLEIATDWNFKQPDKNTQLWYNPDESSNTTWKNLEANLTPLEWNHIIVTINSSGDLNFYLNGELKKTQIGTNIKNMKNPSIWLCSMKGDLKVEFFSGYLQEFAVWNTMLKKEDIEALYNNRMGVILSP